MELLRPSVNLVFYQALYRPEHRVQLNTRGLCARCPQLSTTQHYSGFVGVYLPRMPGSTVTQNRAHIALCYVFCWTLNPGSVFIVIYHGTITRPSNLTAGNSCSWHVNKQQQQQQQLNNCIEYLNLAQGINKACMILPLALALILFFSDTDICPDWSYWRRVELKRTAVNCDSNPGHASRARGAACCQAHSRQKLGCHQQNGVNHTESTLARR